LATKEELEWRGNVPFNLAWIHCKYNPVEYKRRTLQPLKFAAEYSKAWVFRRENL